MRVIHLLFLIAFSAASLKAQAAPRLTLLTPDPAEPIYAPVTALVWQLDVHADSVVASFRAGNRDLSRVVVRRGREFIAVLPPDSALEEGKVRISADVCIFRGACVRSDTLVQVLSEDQRPDADGETKTFILNSLYEVLMWLLRKN